MAKQVLAWQCRYCGVIKKNENIALRHENTCIKNPNARNCLNCINSIQVKNKIPNSSELRPEYWCSIRNIKCSRAVSASCTDFVRR